MMTALVVIATIAASIGLAATIALIIIAVSLCRYLFSEFQQLTQ